MPPDEQQSLIDRALKAMAADRRPFVRHFVKLGENGEILPSGKFAEEMVMRRVWEIVGEGTASPGGEPVLAES